MTGRIEFFNNEKIIHSIGGKDGDNKFELNLKDGEVWVGGKTKPNCRIHLNPITFNIKDYNK